MIRVLKEDGASVATRKLLDDKHSRVAFLDSVQMWPAIERRLRGYLRAIREAGLEDQIVTSASPDWSPAGGAAAMRSLLDARGCATA